jgi:serine/threonine protein kinase/Tol biopolymer transport system component
MSIIGKTLGHYEVTSQLGKGGMGEVYQAKDQKLGRDVAIKVLPEEFAKDTDRVARFQREAKLLASLNHPNIAAIYGLEESAGTNFLVLELVEGETLADRIKQGPIPVEDSMKLGLQMAEALEAAHEKGVIHRDLKPANIKVTSDGKVKVLDFGLAKAFAGDREDVTLSNSPTLSVAATQQGVILGTAAYMSPEQAKGKAVDKRADIWAFGAVLFEMLTGKPAFPGEEVSEILASVIKADANLDLLPPNMHARVREAITRCLQKDLRRRYSGIADARFEIEQALADPGGALALPITTIGSGKRLPVVLPWIAAAALITGLAVWHLKPTPPPEPRRVVRLTYELPRDQEFVGIFPVAVSPDGARLVYATTKGFYLRSLDQLDARLLNGTDKDSVVPFFSPDGQWIGYFSQSDQRLRKIAVAGGPPVVLCDAGSNFSDASWGTDNAIVYSLTPGGIMRVSADGGTPQSLVKQDAAELKQQKRVLVSPKMLQDRKTLLFTSIDLKDARNSQVEVQSLESGERKVLFKGAMTAWVLPSGHLAYLVGNEGHYDLSTVPFDLRKLKVTDEPVFMLNELAEIAISASGSLVYVPATKSAVASAQDVLVWVDLKGKEELVVAPPSDYSLPRISPDGGKVALNIDTAGKTDIWIWDLARENMMRLTFDGAGAGPIWTPDGKRIAFASYSAEEYVSGGIINWKAADGSGVQEKLCSAPDQVFYAPSSWSGDGKTLVAWIGQSLSNYDIGVVSMEGDRKWKALLNEKHHETAPEISHDGHWMAYCSNESGRDEVYVRTFPKVDAGKWQISMGGGRDPRWSRDGRQLFYRNEDAVMAAAVETEPAFRAGKSQLLFRGAYLSTEGWDVHPDGKRFLMVKAGEKAPSAEAPRRINIVLNWLEELKQRVPAGK